MMVQEGVVFETEVEIGRDLSHRYLQGRFDAIVLTGGAREPRDLRVPGRELDGIHFAMPFLVQQNRRLAGEALDRSKEILATGRQVLVLGGGDTGADCVGTALRQGASRVLQFEILPEPPAERSGRTPWPLWPDRRRDSSSHLEGGERRWSVSTRGFTGADGDVREAQCVEVEWASPEGGGAPRPREKTGTEFTVETDLVLLAMGFCGPGKNELVEQLGIRVNEKGFVARDENGMTSSPGTFVAGDMTRGASLVVRAIMDGQEVAKGVARYLERRRAGSAAG
jgi:glutamate synthase (NADPH/NADH) small chain